jgi:hypothetical protein
MSRSNFKPSITHICLTAILWFIALPIAAPADDTLFTVMVEPATTNARVALLSCDKTSSYAITIRFGNRSTHSLAAITYRLRAYDSQGARFVDSLMSQSQALEPGEVGVFTVTTSMQPGETAIVCALAGAQFADGRSWTPGKAWTGHIVALKTGHHQAGATAHASHPVRANSLERAVQITTNGAWTSPTYGQTYVHVRIAIVAKRDVTVSASEFHCLLPLAGGGARSFPALGYATPAVAPNTSGFGITTPTVAKPLVTPAEDLGAIGKLHVHGGDIANTVVTFIVTGGIDQEALSKLSVTWEPAAY